MTHSQEPGSCRAPPCNVAQLRGLCRGIRLPSSSLSFFHWKKYQGVFRESLALELGLVTSSPAAPYSAPTVLELGCTWESAGEL